MNLVHLTILFFFLTHVLSCSEKIDGSSDQAFEDSIERVAEDLDEKEREDFEDAIAKITLADILIGLDLDPYKSHSKERLPKKLDGMAAEEVMEVAEDIDLSDIDWAPVSAKLAELAGSGSEAAKKAFRYAKEQATGMIGGLFEFGRKLHEETAHAGADSKKKLQEEMESSKREIDKMYDELVDDFKSMKKDYSKQEQAAKREFLEDFEATKTEFDKQYQEMRADFEKMRKEGDKFSQEIKKSMEEARKEFEENLVK